MRRGFYRVAYIIAFLLYVGGCSSVATHAPLDLKFVSAEVVDYYNQKDMPTSLGIITAEILSDPDYVSKKGLGDIKKFHQLYIKVYFEGLVNIPKYALSKSSNIRARSSLCEQYNNLSYAQLPSIYVYSNGHLLRSDDAPFLSEGTTSPTPIAYYIYILARQPDENRGNPPLPAYDLLKKPESLCFYVEGHDGVAEGYRSNMVVVPASAISAAMKKLNL
jgi:hypothetical protein